MSGTDDRMSPKPELRAGFRTREWFALVTGLNLAFAICHLTCKTPWLLTLSWETRLIRSALYIVASCASGAAGTWVTLPRSSYGQFGHLVRSGVRGWIFLPALILFLQQQSVWALALAAMAAALMALSLGPMQEPPSLDGRRFATSDGHAAPGLFATEVPVAPASWRPFLITVCLYAAIVMSAASRNVLAAVLVAGGAFLLVLYVMEHPRRLRQEQDQVKRRQPKFSSLLGMAFLCVFLALSAASGSLGDGFLGLGHAGLPAGGEKKLMATQPSPNAYHTIVLWPPQKEEKVIPAAPLRLRAASPGIARQWVIPFYGPYWYYKSAQETPGPTARTTKGDPLKVNVHSTDSGPLLMEAHQRLPDPVALSCCRAMQVVFQNDAALGAIGVGVMLTDSHTHGASASLGVECPASVPLHGDQGKPAEETLTFHLPRAAAIQQFDGITVIFMADARHRTAGRRVAVERFVMLPE